MDWSRSSFAVGMPHMVPEQLSEVELLKIAGDCQWKSISRLLGLPSRQIVNEFGERLYASFINVELHWGSRPPCGFEEGATVTLRHAARTYNRRFAEGLLAFDDREIADEALAGLTSYADLAGLETPWVYLTNAFVSREASNLRLRTFAPAGVSYDDRFTTDVLPPGIRSHEQAQQAGSAPALAARGAKPLRPAAPLPIVYDIVPESDLNGAGLLYFARYVAVMNYGERMFLRRCLERPVSSQLIRFLTPLHRRVFYFANAEDSDSISIRVSAAVAPFGDAGGAFAPGRTVPFQMSFVIDLYRESDGMLMATSAVAKALAIPAGVKSAIVEADRLAAAWAL